MSVPYAKVSPMTNNDEPRTCDTCEYLTFSPTICPACEGA